MQISVLAVVSRNYSMLTSTCFTPPIINRWLGKYFWGKHVWPDSWNVCSSSLLVIYATFGKNKQIHALLLGTLNFWQNVWFYCTDTICREVNRWCNHTSWFFLLLFHVPFLFPDLPNCYIPSNTKRQYGIEFAVPSRMNVVQYGIIFKYHCDYSDIAGRQTVWLVCEVLGDLSEVLWCEYAQTVWSSERSCYSISGLDLPSSLSLYLVHHFFVWTVWTFFTFLGFSAAEVVIVGLTWRAMNGRVPQIYFLYSHFVQIAK